MRDLLRRRTNLVDQRTALMLRFKSLYVRTSGRRDGPFRSFHNVAIKSDLPVCPKYD